MIVSLIDKIENYAPIVAHNDGSYTVNFDCKEEFADDLKLINGKYVAAGKVATGFASWKTMNFKSKPSFADIKDAIINNIDKATVYSIENMFVWNGCNVDLNKTNQSNYKAAYDLAVQTNGMSLPVKFKFKKGGDNFYYTFDSIEELTDFYTKAIKHINSCLEAGWEHKDSICWPDYNI